MLRVDCIQPGEKRCTASSLVDAIGLILVKSFNLRPQANATDLAGRSTRLFFAIAISFLHRSLLCRQGFNALAGFPFSGTSSFKSQVAQEFPLMALGLLEVVCFFVNISLPNILLSSTYMVLSSIFRGGFLVACSEKMVPRHASWLFA